ncbi:MAG: OmpA family protein [Schleiferiaceae bacterium]|nr:OmpA family protein [Schleiferiaceae bacterium]
MQLCARNTFGRQAYCFPWLPVAFFFLVTVSLLRGQTPVKERLATDSLVYHEAYFALDEARVNAAARSRLDSLLAQWPWTVVRMVQLEGHTDSLASANYNLDLSKRRVVKLLQYLISTGLDPRKVQTGYYGEERPRYLKDTLRAKNRRVELLLYVDKQRLPSPEKKLIDYAFRKGDKLRIPNLQFVGNQAVPTWQSMPVLYELVRVMKRYPDLAIELQGHVCCSGDQQLSEARARMVYHFLRDHGIAAKRMEYRGYSNTRPLYEEVDERTKALNRRVEIKVLRNTDRENPNPEIPKPQPARAPVLDLEFIRDSPNLTPAGDFMLTLVAEMMKTAEGYLYEFVVYDNLGDPSMTARRKTTLQRLLRRKGVPAKSYNVLHRPAPEWMPTTTGSNAVMVEIIPRP